MVLFKALNGVQFPLSYTHISGFGNWKMREYVNVGILKSFGGLYRMTMSFLSRLIKLESAKVPDGASVESKSVNMLPSDVKQKLYDGSMTKCVSCTTNYILCK